MSGTNPSHWLASDIDEAAVSDAAENKIGDVTDLVVDSGGNITAAVTGVGGFLGAGQKDVAVSFKDPQVTARIGSSSIGRKMS